MKTFLEWLNKGLYNEVDWDNDFSDVHVTCEDPEKIINNAKKAGKSLQTQCHSYMPNLHFLEAVKA